MACQGVYECEYDYLLTGRREIALATLEMQNKLSGLKLKGSERCNFLYIPFKALKEKKLSIFVYRTGRSNALKGSASL